MLPSRSYIFLRGTADLIRYSEIVPPHESFASSNSHDSAEMLIKTSANCFFFLSVYTFGGKRERGSGSPHNIVRMCFDITDSWTTREDRWCTLLQSYDASRMGILFAAGPCLGPWQYRWDNLIIPCQILLMLTRTCSLNCIISKVVKLS